MELDLLAWDVKAMVLHSFVTVFTLCNIACSEGAMTKTWHMPGYRLSHLQQWPNKTWFGFVYNVFKLQWELYHCTIVFWQLGLYNHDNSVQFMLYIHVWTYTCANLPTTLRLNTHAPAISYMWSLYGQLTPMEIPLAFLYFLLFNIHLNERYWLLYTSKSVVNVYQKQWSTFTKSRHEIDVHLYLLTYLPMKVNYNLYDRCLNNYDFTIDTFTYDRHLHLLTNAKAWDVLSFATPTD